MTQIVYSITGCTIAILPTHPPVLEAKFEGETTTPDWTGFALEPVPSPSPPPGGIYEAKLLGVPPGGIVPEVITAFHDKATWPGFPHNLEGLKLISATNAVTVRL